MTTARIALAREVPEALAIELEKRLYFVSSAIEGYSLVEEGGVIRAIELELGHGEDIGAIAEKIDHVIAREVLTQRPIEARVVWRSRASTPVFTDAFGSLVRAGLASEAGEGQVAYGEPLISLVDYLDARLRGIAMRYPGAREFRYPTLLPTRVLERFGYFSSFPQLVMFVTRLHNDVENYDAFVREYGAEGRIFDSVFTHCNNHDYCLPPTMCYHTYHQHRERELGDDMVVTSRGKSFRFESRYHRGFERLWDFTIREVVFMGTPEFAEASRRSFMAQSFELMDELGLAGTCEVANDHFFASQDCAGKILAQRMMELKYELQLEVAAGRSIAVASFNLHGHHFGEAFAITRADQAMASGCVGFGLERLAHAFVCQHGLEPARWPASVREGVA